MLSTNCNPESACRQRSGRWGGTGCTAQGAQFTEMYSYSSGGLSLKKKLGVSRGARAFACESGLLSYYE
jgi:hypothetical protein